MQYKLYLGGLFEIIIEITNNCTKKSEMCIIELD